ncbi:MAG TPA: hypothetical protein VFL13_02540, partial [Candidatus Baltobacteraceae bacterium]|nr:hypothetical protein [Candidatus Baltobacteraceae bacterium]
DLVPFDARPRAQRLALYGTRAQLAASGGPIEGQFALAACDRRAAVATYALRIDNNGDAPLRARMFCFGRKGQEVQGYPLDVAIAPFSRCDTLLPVRLHDVGPYDRAVVRVEGSDVAFSLEAPAPGSQPRRVPWLAAVAGSIALTLGAAFGAEAATPGINMIAAPSRVFAGVPLEIPYAYRGWATLRYALKTADGRQLAAGLTHDKEGTLKFNVPNAAGTALTLNVAVAGPFGQRSALQRIGIDANAAPSHKPLAARNTAQPPRISSFAIETPSVHAGGPIAFAYSTNASSGDIWLIDESGRLWASTPIDASGQSSLTVPQGAAGRQLRAVMRAKNGKQDAVAGVAVTVLPGAVVAQATAPAQNAPSTPAPPATLSLSKSQAAPGETITVSIAGAYDDASIVLNDRAGTAVESGDISGGQTDITFTAPSRPGVYYINANVTSGNASQTLIKALTVK